ncbi:MAG TPA: hypothetical protein VIK52_14185 [Opitutaceae bacterium]
MTDAELLHAVAEFREGILEGRPSNDMCFAICWPLESFLATCGVEVKLVMVSVPACVTGNTVASDHYVLELPDGRIIDPTADQFPVAGLPPVYIGLRPDVYSAPWYDDEQEVCS